MKVMTREFQKEKGRFIKPRCPTYFKLLGDELKVGCQLHLPYEENPQNEDPHVALFVEYNRRGLAYLDSKNKRVQIFEEGLAAPGDDQLLFTLDWRASVLFSGKNRSMAQYMKLVFWRKKSDQIHQGLWMTCARASEEHAFGFSLEEARNPYWVYLAYPGLDGAFEPFYLKVIGHERKDIMYYIVTAKDVGYDSDVLIEISAVPESGVPHALVVTAPLMR